jgi:hypothetical protein
MKRESCQLIEELVAIVPVKHKSIPADVTILKSHKNNEQSRNGEDLSEEWFCRV